MQCFVRWVSSFVQLDQGDTTLRLSLSVSPHVPFLPPHQHSMLDANTQRKGAFVDGLGGFRPDLEEASRGAGPEGRPPEPHQVRRGVSSCPVPQEPFPKNRSPRTVPQEPCPKKHKPGREC